MSESTILRRSDSSRNQFQQGGSLPRPMNREVVRFEVGEELHLHFLGGDARPSGGEFWAFLPTLRDVIDALSRGRRRRKDISGRIKYFGLFDGTAHRVANP